MLPVREKSVYGASTILLDFHTCHLLLGTAVKMQQSKDQVSRVRARSHFMHVDKNGDKALDKDEMRTLLTEMGELPTDDDIDEIFDNYATDSEMSEDQFVGWWMARRQAAKELITSRAHSLCAEIKARILFARPPPR